MSFTSTPSDAYWQFQNRVKSFGDAGMRPLTLAEQQVGSPESNAYWQFQNRVKSFGDAGMRPLTLAEQQVGSNAVAPYSRPSLGGGGSINALLNIPMPEVNRWPNTFKAQAPTQMPTVGTGQPWTQGSAMSFGLPGLQNQWADLGRQGAAEVNLNLGLAGSQAEAQHQLAAQQGVQQAQRGRDTLQSNIQQLLTALLGGRGF